MRISLWIKVSDLPAYAQKVGSHDKKLYGRTLSTGLNLSPDERLGLYRIYLTDPSATYIVRFLEIHELTCEWFELEETMMLEDPALRPIRGIYRFGSDTNAIVDTFFKSGLVNGEPYPIQWKVFVRGKNPQSVIDCYNKIRARLIKPAAPWDEVPEEEKDGSEAVAETA